MQRIFRKSKNGRDYYSSNAVTMITVSVFRDSSTISATKDQVFINEFLSEKRSVMIQKAEFDDIYNSALKQISYH